MKVLQVIHGYPMRYNAGSEVYTQTLSQALAKTDEVHVFTRQENTFAPDFGMIEEYDRDKPEIKLHIINIPRHNDRYRHDEVDAKFLDILHVLKPEVVHIGHLNHLSTSIIRVAAEQGISIVFTLHDYWLMCPRGQFIQRHPSDENDVWAVCDGQEDEKCADRCYARYYSGLERQINEDRNYWTHWIKNRMDHIKELTELVDIFIAPSRYLFNRFYEEFGLSKAKLRYLDYGFEIERLRDRKRIEDEPFTFGYIGTHIPAKGIDYLIRAFGKVRGEVTLRIWGRHRGNDTETLKSIAELNNHVNHHLIEWLPEYKNSEIVNEVFNRIDALVVPSIWVENSPLVIHEAQQARVPVITADTGGMSEYVHHEVNGLLFNHRSISSLTDQMQRCVDNPEFIAKLGERGYLFSENGDIPSIHDHVSEIRRIYSDVIRNRNSARDQSQIGPWRITFDTNPDTCNLHCIMCEEHSLFSDLQTRRKKEGREPRLMPFDLIERIVTEAVPHGLREIIPSTMGEPLLYKDFEKVIDLCSQKGVKLNLTTNGTFPRLGAVRWAEKIVPVASDVKISWNGASKSTQESIMLGSRWDKVLSNVKTLIRVRDAHAAGGGNRCQVTFQLTFLESNLRELDEIVKLAIELGVDRIKGHHLWAHFDQIKELSMRRNTDSILRWNEAVRKAQKAAQASKLPNGETIRLENIFELDGNSVKELSPEAECPFLGKEAWVSAAGRFDPCCAPDVQRRTLGDFGNLHDHELMEIWKGEKYNHLRNSYLENELCRGCNMRKPRTHL